MVTSFFILLKFILCLWQDIPRSTGRNLKTEFIFLQFSDQITLNSDCWTIWLKTRTFIVLDILNKFFFCYDMPILCFCKLHSTIGSLSFLQSGPFLGSQCGTYIKAKTSQYLWHLQLTPHAAMLFINSLKQNKNFTDLQGKQQCVLLAAALMAWIPLINLTFVKCLFL